MTGVILISACCYLLGVFVGSYTTRRQRVQTPAPIRTMTLKGNTLTWRQLLGVFDQDLDYITAEDCTVNDVPLNVLTLGVGAFLLDHCGRGKAFTMRDTTFNQEGYAEPGPRCSGNRFIQRKDNV